MKEESKKDKVWNESREDKARHLAKLKRINKLVAQGRDPAEFDSSLLFENLFLRRQKQGIKLEEVARRIQNCVGKILYTVELLQSRTKHKMKWVVQEEIEAIEKDLELLKQLAKEVDDNY